MANAGRAKRWLHEHRRDAYVRMAQADGMRSRAVYKLEQIDQRDGLLRPGMAVVDLGAAPGGWSQFAAQKLGARGKVVAVDLLAMEALTGVHCIEADAGDPQVRTDLAELLGADRGGADLVMSDMAPNLSGVRVRDEAQGEYLGEVVVDVVDEVLKPGGSVVAKAFHGRGFETLRQALRERFSKVAVRKPSASRSRSAEIYLVGKGYGV